MIPNKTPPESAEILLYQTRDRQTRLEVRLQEETVWLTQKRMAELFQKNVRTINEHIHNIFGEGEDRFDEKTFAGPFTRIARDALSHLQANYPTQTVVKHPDRAKAGRFWNYPYAAIEEAVVDSDFNENGTEMISFTRKRT